MIYTIPGCPHCDAAREDLEWRGIEYEEIDIEQNEEARDRMLHLTGGSRTVPVIVEEGKPTIIGWIGRGCAV
jgi:glutaredoxin